MPAGAHVLNNPRGTAPAFIAARDGRLIAALPGVPSELQWLTEHALIPRLRDAHGASTVRVVREVRLSGITESAAGERIAEMFKLENPVVGITAKAGQYTLRFAATAATAEAAEALIAPLVVAVHERFGDLVLGSEKLEELTTRRLRERGVAVRLHESLISGPVYRLLASTADGRAVLAAGGVVIGAAGPASAELARSIAEQSAGDGALGLAVLAAEPQGDTMTTVYLAASYAGQTDESARAFDLQIVSGQELIAAAAVELARRLVERGQP